MYPEILINGMRYRVTGTEIVCFGTGDRFSISKADFYYMGKWHPVKNIQILKEIYKKIGE